MPAGNKFPNRCSFIGFRGCYYERLPANINLPQRNKIIASNDCCKEFMLKNGVNKRKNEFERAMSLRFLLLYFRKGI
jgi:hypothetical protein